MELTNKLRYFGIPEAIELQEESSTRVKIVTGGEKEDQASEAKEQEEEKKDEGREEKPKPPIESRTEPGKHDLVDVDELIFEDAEERTPYVKADGSKNIPSKVIKLRSGHRGGNGEESQRGVRERANRADAESIALELVMRYEEDIEGRQVDDRHKQPGIGYDIYSEDSGKDERYIEVKHFRGEAGAWELTPHQWKKAEQEGDKYYVYVVSGLKEGASPIIELIQNPVKYLSPDPPAQKKFSDWKNGVVKIITSQRV
jgi:hypothetical protein